MENIIPEDQNISSQKNNPPARDISPLVLSLILMIFLCLWLIIVRLSYPGFQDSRTDRPFAEIENLAPFFFILIGSFGLTASWILMKFRVSKKMMLAFLLLGGLMLWYTPYLIAGFVKQTDTLWHMGMATNIPEIMNGAGMPFSSYATSFPQPYVFAYGVFETLGIDSIILANYIFPLVFLTIFIVFVFTISSKFYSPRTSALATLISISLLYYVELHFSPHVIGTIFLFSAILLLLNHQYIFGGLFGIVLLPMTHTVSFGMFLIFCVVYFVAYRDILEKQFVSRKSKQKLDMKKIMIGAAIIVFSIFLAMFTHISVYVDLFFSKLISSNFAGFVIDNLFDNPWFKQIASIIFLAIFTVFAVIVISHILNHYKTKKNIFKVMLDVKPTSQILIAFPILALGFSIAIGAIINRSVMIERGLTIFVILGILFILGFLFTREKKIDSKVIAAGVLALFLLYPACSYTIDSYNSYSISERSGMEYLTANVSITDQSIYMSSPGQINSFIVPGDMVVIEKEIYEISNYIVYRLHAQYKSDLHNSNPSPYTLLFEDIESNSTFQKIYHNPSFYIYLNLDGN